MPIYHCTGNFFKEEGLYPMGAAPQSDVRKNLGIPFTAH